MVALRLCFAAALGFGILSGVAAQVPSETRSSSPSGGHFAFSEVQHDFGRIRDDHPVDWKFSFTNASSAKVTILHVDTSCGCTTTNVAKKVYEPGASGELIATFNPLTRQGKE